MGGYWTPKKTNDKVDVFEPGYSVAERYFQTEVNGAEIFREELASWLFWMIGTPISGLSRTYGVFFPIAGIVSTFADVTRTASVKATVGSLFAAILYAPFDRTTATLYAVAVLLGILEIVDGSKRGRHR